MTCAICKFYDVCIMHNHVNACTHDDPEHVKEWALGLPDEHSQEEQERGST